MVYQGSTMAFSQQGLNQKPAYTEITDTGLITTQLSSVFTMPTHEGWLGWVDDDDDERMNFNVA